MAGADILKFVDLAHGGIDQYPPLLDWICSWTEQSDLQALTLEGWLEEGHGITGGLPDRRNVWIPTYCGKDQMSLWATALAVADAAVEELLKSRHKRLDIFHVVMIPRLMAPRWHHLFNKACDFLFVASPSLTFWPTKFFEPLWVSIILPFANCRPWSLKQAPLLVEMGRDLRRLLETSEGDARNLLQKLLQLPKWLATLPQHMACGVLHLPRPHQVLDACNSGGGRERLAQGGGTEEKNDGGS
jgi:hypothetical protein